MWRHRAGIDKTSTTPRPEPQLEAVPGKVETRERDAPALAAQGQVQFDFWLLH